MEDRLSRALQRSVSAALAGAAKRHGAEVGLCSARTGEGVDELFCSVLAACLEGNGLPAAEPVLNRVAGTLTSAQLMEHLLRRHVDRRRSRPLELA
ncbi:unnamed protein product [Effrenium voratum]|uniref:Uncharacterized protein n=1 Tax=Effrenium voratum TaxID=2562239 RepID=A0AA36MRT2_9DINO|nr:unnamed protein product [Effrenium voratum]CAJ1439460.1 unnamed protein product [Effrenium voratum]CAJ1450589.1 unnamed protein product [Effrenium voratum]